jgi:hypothetical protein
MNGSYHYWMNGTRTDITETFRITTAGTSATVIESQRHAEAFGSQIKVTAHYMADQLLHFAVEWQNTTPGAIREARAHYQFDTDNIHVRRLLDGRVFHEHLPRPHAFTVLPLLRVFTGRAIRQAYALGRGGKVPVLVPNIKDPADAIQLLALELSLRSVTHLGSDTLSIADQEQPAEVFNFQGGSYDQIAKFWVDEHDILLKYEWQQGDVFWEVRLTQTSTQVHK